MLHTVEFFTHIDRDITSCGWCTTKVNTQGHSINGMADLSFQGWSTAKLDLCMDFLGESNIISLLWFKVMFFEKVSSERPPTFISKCSAITKGAVRNYVVLHPGIDTVKVQAGFNPTTAKSRSSDHWATAMVDRFFCWRIFTKMNILYDLFCVTILYNLFFVNLTILYNLFCVTILYNLFCVDLTILDNLFCVNLTILDNLFCVNLTILDNLFCANLTILNNLLC